DVGGHAVATQTQRRVTEEERLQGADRAALVPDGVEVRLRVRRRILEVGPERLLLFWRDRGRVTLRDQGDAGRRDGQEGQREQEHGGASRAHRSSRIPTACAADTQRDGAHATGILLAARKRIAYSTRRMRYEYTPEQLAWRDEVRTFCDAHVSDALRAELRQAGNEGDGPLREAFHAQLFERGWWGVGWPKEFGGMGKAAVEQYIFIDEMQMAGAPAMNLSITSVAPTNRREGAADA